jgi:hypothetical protein
MRSASSSVSVSTVSTGLSRSPSPPSKSRMSASPQRPGSSYRHEIVKEKPTDSERKRRRDSVSSADSYISEDRRVPRRGSRERTSSRSTRRKFTEFSPQARGRRTESRSRSPFRARRPLSNDRKRMNIVEQEYRAPPRERSMSPFSKRLALTKSLGR